MDMGSKVLKVLETAAEPLDRHWSWSSQPFPLGLATLIGLRQRLRARNLYDTGVPALADDELEAAGDPRTRRGRRRDGRFNDLARPGAGSVDAPFGRNAPALPAPEAAVAEGPPSPKQVSDELLRRDRFLAAEGLNVLAAAWVQFEVHDWFSHAKAYPAAAGRASQAGDWELAAEASPDGGREDGERMPLARALVANAGAGGPRNYVCRETHWWDASQLYGSREPFATAIRTGDRGQILVDDDLLQALEQAVTDANAPEANLWVGLAVLHILFAREHGAIARRLAEVYPHWDDERLYDTARLVNSALMAKIHTVEWTPMMVGHPTTVRSIRATWWGLLGEGIRRRVGRLHSSEIWSGIPGSSVDDHGVPYALTEEFVAVYRMHPLMPDEYRFHRADDDAPIGDVCALPDLAVQPGNVDRPRELLGALGGPANVLYSLGVAPPGQISLFNYPDALRNWPRLGGLPPIDLARADILRTRECGVAPYNNFRRLFHLRPARSFEEVTGGNREWAAAVRDVYDDDLEAVDLMVGLFGERKPRGFAFSETAFRVFLLMAARRLQSDRFFTTDYTPEVYTPVGLRWIDETTMADVVRRHYPQLAGALDGVDNAFTPWRRASAGP